MEQNVLDTVVEQYYREIYLFCFSRLLDKQAVDDVVQNVFMTLQEKSDELTPDHIRAWLYSVAQKKLLEEKRNKVRRSRFVNYDVEVTAKDHPSVYELVEEQITDSEVDALKARILRMLSPEERALFETIYEKRIKRKEAAQLYNITENALNVRVYRLKKHIKSLAQEIMMLIVFMIVKCS